MASADVLNNISRQIYIYGYSFIFLTGIIGNSINILMFTTSLKGNPCSLYLLTATVCDCLEIFIWIVPFTVQIIYGKNGTESFLPWCKLMPYLADVFTMTSVAALCLASIDRYHSTCRTVHRRQWSSTKIAKILLLLAFVVSLLLEIPDLVLTIIVTDGNGSYCIVVDNTYYSYMNYFQIPFLWTFIPFGILLIFGFLIRRNLKNIQVTATVANNHRVQPKKTRKQYVDEQLIRMLVLEIVCFFISTVTWSSMSFYFAVTFYWEKNQWRQAVESLITSIAAVIYLLYTSNSFYVYYLSSSAYRKRVKQMWKKIFGLRRGLMIWPTAIASNIAQLPATHINRSALTRMET